MFGDTNNNSKLDAGEAGIPNVTVKLFAYGTDPLTATAVATATTGANGTYSLATYTQGQYFVHIPKSNFAAAVVNPNTGAITTRCGSALWAALQHRSQHHYG